MVVIVVILLLALATVTGWKDARQAHAALGETRSKLAATSVQLTSTRSDLVSAREKLADEESETAKLRRKLQEAQGALTRTEGSLSQAEDRMDLQANQIETLKSCLTGVQRSLSYVAYDDYTNALAELQAVEVACDRANDLM